MVVTRRRSIIVFVAVLSRMCLVSGLAQNGKIRPERIELGDLIGSGEFGRVHWGNYCSSQKEGNAPPERIVAKSAKPGVPLAAAYLETEAYVNRRLSLESNGRKCPYIDCPIYLGVHYKRGHQAVGVGSNKCGPR